VPQREVMAYLKQERLRADAVREQRIVGAFAQERELEEQVLRQLLRDERERREISGWTLR
jgi:hypothetical protein